MLNKQVTVKNRINTYLYEKAMNFIPKKNQYELEYRRQQGKKINLQNPQRLTEKLLWLVRYNELYKKEFIQQIYDKHTVREYVKGKGLEDILIRQIGHYKSIDEVDIENLPEKFALKMTQSCGENVICTDKSKLDIEEVKEKFHRWGVKNKTNSGLQAYYFTSKESIVCEELILDENGKIPCDFRVCCCNGEPRFIYYDIDSLDDNNDKKETYYRECFDLEWNYLPVDFVHRPRKNKQIAYTKKPGNLEEILELSRILAKDFIFVRVDFYLTGNKIYFGELTPCPGLSGGFEPDEWDFKFGNMLELPDVKIF